MATYSLTSDGEIDTLFTKYTYKGVPTLKNAFPNTIDNGKILKRKRGVKGRLRDLYDTRDNPTLVRQIFGNLLLLIFEKVANGDLFIIPGRASAHMCLKKIPDIEVRRLRQLGKYADVDIVKARFTLPRFVYDFGPRSLKRDMQIYVPRRYSEMAKRNVENGKIPFHSIRKI